MRRTVYLLLVLAVFAGTMGCGREPNKPRELEPLAPLSVADWKQLPVEEKYEPETFERLKLKEPNLRSERGWRRFMITVVVPERKEDIPEG